MSEIKVPKIYGAICDIMSEIGAIGKNKRSQQNYNYRGVDDVMNALQPAMIQHRVFVSPEVLDEKREDRISNKGGTLIYTILKVKYTFYADDGSSVTAIVNGEGMDSGDKSANKAMSVAFKYACFQVFCIPTEEMVDPDAETPPPSKPMPTQAPTTPTAITPQGRSHISSELKKLTVIKEEQTALLRKTLDKWNIDKTNQLLESDVNGFVADMVAIHRATPVDVSA